MKKRVISILLTVIMTVSLVVPAYADEQMEVPESEQELSEEEYFEEEYLEETNSDEAYSASFDEDAPEFYEEAARIDRLREEDRDNDELFADYVEHEFATMWGDISLLAIGRGDELTGTDKVLYDKFLEFANGVADGNISDATMTIPVYELFEKTPVDGYFELVADDYGLGSLDGKTKDALQVMLANLLNVDFRSAYYAVNSDSPQSLYWFDKTAGWGSSRDGYSWRYNSSSFFVSDDCMFSVKFNVSADYSDGGAFRSTDVDTEKTGATAIAVSNARNVVLAADSLSDYDKLDYYRDWICDHNTYNDYAADDSNHVHYGDPWQMIYVFDNDNDTNVVCEGYAKAFQFLCDNSVFGSEDIHCYIVEGTGYNRGGYGPHMWNIVHMDDGYNYHTDITWCDGSYDKRAFFLLGALRGSVSGGYYYSEYDRYVYRFTETNDRGEVYENRFMTQYSEDDLTIKIGERYTPGSSYVCVPPSDLTATYGQTLSDVSLLGKNPAGNEPGSFAWVNPSQSVGNVGTHSFSAIFTPTDTNYAAKRVNISVTVSKAEPVCVAPTGITATYGQRLSDVSLSGLNPVGNTAGSFAWVSPSASVGNVGTNSFSAVFTPTNSNYNTKNVTISVTVAKAEPVCVAPTGLAAVYGQTLSDVSLSGLNPAGNTAGSFAWVNPSQSVGNVGTNSFSAIFTPTNSNYNTKNVTISVTVAKAEPVCVAPTGISATYGQRLSDVSLSGLNPVGNTAGSFAWVSPSASVGNVGTNSFSAVFTPTNANYATKNVTISVTVAKAEPVCVAPSGITATYGQTLSDVSLAGLNPVGNTAGSFAWVSPSASVGNVGTNSFSAVFTPTNSNYNTKNVTISVTVAKAEPVCAAPTGLAATYGQRLSDVSLSGLNPVGNTAGSFSWVNPSQSVGNAGTHSFSAVFTPTNANYATKNVTISVTVAKAEPVCVAPTGITATYGQRLSDVSLSGLNPVGNTAGSFAWVSPSASVGNVGTNSFSAVFTPTNSNYNTKNITIYVTVNKATISLSPLMGEVSKNTGESTSFNLPSLPVGVSYGSISGSYSDKLTVSLNALKTELIVTSKGFEEEISLPITVEVLGGSNYQDTSLTVNVFTTGMREDDGVLREDYEAVRYDTAENEITIVGIPNDGAAYTGSNITFDIRVYKGKVLLKEGDDYTVKYSNNRDACTNLSAAKAPSVTIVGKGDYSKADKKLSQTIKFKINPIEITNGNGFTIISDSVLATANSKAVTPVPTVLYKGKKLSKKDFKLSYSSGSSIDSSKSGDYTITIEGIGNYSGCVDTVYTIVPIDSPVMSKAKINGIKKSLPYNGGNDVVQSGYSLSCKIGKEVKTLTEGVDYTVSYKNNNEAGMAGIVFTAKPGNEYNIVGEKTVTFKIVGTPISKTVVTYDAKTDYTGKMIRPSVKVVAKTGRMLVEGTDYSVSYRKNVNAGKAEILISGMGEYTGTVKKSFKINPIDLSKEPKVTVSVDSSSVRRETSGKNANKYVADVVVTCGERILKEGKDYVVAYKNNNSTTPEKDAGKVVLVAIKGVRNYAKTKTTSFTVN